ncbi:MAG: tetratricopeptide repeat protein [bacterium]
MSADILKLAFIGIVLLGVFLLPGGIALSKTAGEDPHVIFYRGLFQEIGLGELESAIKTYRTKSSPPYKDGRLVGRALIREGICFEKMGREKEALKCYRTAIAQSPDNASLLKKSLREMEVFFPRSAPLFARDKELENLIEEGKQYAKRGDLEGAKDKFQKALYLNPDNPTLQLQLASTYKRLGRCREAALYYKLALGSDLYRNDPQVYRDLAASHVAAKDAESAIKLWRSYLASGSADNSTRREALFELEMLYEAAYGPLAQVIPQDLETRLEEGAEQTREGHYQEALSTYKVARIKYPKSYLPFYRLGAIYDYLLSPKRKYDYVIHYYREALKRAPATTAQRLRYRLALICEEHGDIDNASRYIEQYFSKHIRPMEDDNLVRERIRKKWDHERVRRLRKRK